MPSVISDTKANNPAPKRYWQDGEMLLWRNSAVGLMTHSLHYGSAVFEGLACYNGKIFMGEKHYERLHLSAKVAEIELKYSPKELLRVTERLVEEENISMGYIRAFAWLGDEDVQIVGLQCSSHIAVVVWERMLLRSMKQKLSGIKLNFGKYLKPTPDNSLVNSKSSSLYATARIVKIQAIRAGFHDGIMLDVNGNIAELSGANIFFVKGNEIHTPTTAYGLNGITRMTVIDLARQNGMQVFERDISPFELGSFTESFATGTAMEIVRIEEISYNGLEELYQLSDGVKAKHLVAGYERDAYKDKAIVYKNSATTKMIINEYAKLTGA